MPNYRLPQAAAILGVSDDTVRRWADTGKLSTITDASGHKVVDGVVLAHFAKESAGEVGSTWGQMGATSARNTLPGIVTAVTADTVMAQVELQCGPFRIVSLMSKEAAEDLELQAGVIAIASVKATNVVVAKPMER